MLSTARDIISLWVARMVMSGLYCTGRVPFQHVCIHPTIQDGQGRRMSKSLGNGVDPLDLIEMYGADAMRFTLASLAGDTQDIRVPVKPATLPDGRTVNTSERFELGRNFCNKLWQAATGFVLPNLGGQADRSQADHGPGNQGAKQGAAPADLTLALEDRWILSRLSECVARFDRALARYAYNEAATAVYDFFWSEFCDWYVEWVKPRLFEKPAEAGEAAGGKPRGGADSAASAATARRVLAFVLDQSLRVMHPIMPFITEALWHKLNATAPRRGLAQLEPQPDALIAAPWPDAGAMPRDPDAEREMSALQGILRAVREIRARINALRSQGKQPAIRALPRAVVRADAELSRKLLDDLAVLRRLGQCDEYEIGPQAAKPADAFSSILAGVEVYVPVAGLANLSIERARLHKQLEELRGHAQRVEAKLSNDGFVAKAAPAVVEKERARLAELREQAASVERNLRELGQD